MVGESTERYFGRIEPWGSLTFLVPEYPRQTNDGEQMDFVEVMEIDEGLIRRHRVYWGWRRLDLLVNDEYYR